MSCADTDSGYHSTVPLDPSLTGFHQDPFQALAYSLRCRAANARAAAANAAWRFHAAMAIAHQVDAGYNPGDHVSHSFPPIISDPIYGVHGDSLPNNEDVPAPPYEPVLASVAPLDNRTVDKVYGRTTLMIRNLPSSVTRTSLLAAIDASGYTDSCDFAYLPMEFGTKNNKGYAFVNFKTAEAASKFSHSWHGTRRLGEGHSSISISAAVLQGFDVNARRLSSNRVRRIRNPEMRPACLT